MTELKKLKGEEYVEMVSGNIKRRVRGVARPFYKLKITEENQETDLKVTFSLVAKVWALPVLYLLFLIIFLAYFIGIGFVEETYSGLFRECKKTIGLTRNPVNEACFYDKAE